MLVILYILVYFCFVTFSVTIVIFNFYIFENGFRFLISTYLLLLIFFFFIFFFILFFRIYNYFFFKHNDKIQGSLEIYFFLSLLVLGSFLISQSLVETSSTIDEVFDPKEVDEDSNLCKKTEQEVSKEVQSELNLIEIQNLRNSIRVMTNILEDFVKIQKNRVNVFAKDEKYLLIYNQNLNSDYKNIYPIEDSIRIMQGEYLNELTIVINRKISYLNNLNSSINNANLLEQSKSELGSFTSYLNKNYKSHLEEMNKNIEDYYINPQNYIIFEKKTTSNNEVVYTQVIDNNIKQTSNTNQVSQGLENLNNFILNSDGTREVLEVNNVTQKEVDKIFNFKLPSVTPQNFDFEEMLRNYQQEIIANEEAVGSDILNQRCDEIYRDIDILVDNEIDEQLKDQKHN